MSRRAAIGFDRPIRLEWLDAVAAKVAAGEPPPAVRKYLYSVLEGLVPGATKNSARGKTVTVLSHIWCLVPSSAENLRARAAKLLSDTTGDDRLGVHWAMMIGTYPFFTDIAGALGRLLSLHGSVTMAQMKRRLAEAWGERSTIDRAIPRILRSMVQWGVLAENEEAVFTAAGPARLVNPGVSALLVEAVLIDSEQHMMEAQQLLGHPALFPFQLPIGLRDLRASKRFRVSRQGMDLEFVELVSGAASNDD